MVSKIKQRLASDEGFTLIELLVVIVILGILLAIAVPSYLGFKDRAEKSAAAANVRAAVPSVEAYYSDHGSYTSTMTLAKLQTSYDAGLRSDIVVKGSGASYCIASHHGNHVFRKQGPSAQITEDTADATATAACP